MLERLLNSDLPDRDRAFRARSINIAACCLFAILLLATVAGGIADMLGVWWMRTQWFLALGIAAAGAALSYLFSHRGKLSLAAWALVISANGLSLFLLIVWGHHSPAPMLIPTALLATAMLIGRRAAVGFGIGWLILFASTSRSLPGAEAVSSFAGLFAWGRLAAIAAAALLAWFVADTLTEAIADARRTRNLLQLRDRELDQVRATMADQVHERTQELERALNDLQAALAERETILNALRGQSIPVVPLFRRVIAVPVVGMLDDVRAKRMLSGLLDGIEQYDARVALLDVTGVPFVDKAAAEGLAQAVSAARLVGAQCVLVGVNPDIASTLVDLGLDLSIFTSRADMETGLRYAMEIVNELPQVPHLR